MAYARTVLHRINIDQWRRRQRRPERLVSSAPEAARPVDDHDLRVALLDALARLTAKQRSVLVLRFLEDRTESQTAVILGCSANTVKSQTRHALARLRQLNPELIADLASVRKEE